MFFWLTSQNPKTKASYFKSSNKFKAQVKTLGKLDVQVSGEKVCEVFDHR